MGTGQVVPSHQGLEDGVIPAALGQVLGHLNSEHAEQVDNLFFKNLVKESLSLP